jgi:potassium-transporting ATPase KdpC subunit
VRKDILRSVLALVASTLALGLAYPLVMTGIAQVALPDQADGSLIRDARGEVIGSTLLARDVEDAPRSFHPRPSATGYSASVTSFANRGPNQRSTRDLTRQHIDAYITAEAPYNPGLTPARVPVDAATFSASGADPHISEANAAIQARRVVAVRHLPLARVRVLIAQNTDGRGLGVFGEPGVNTTTLNLALDQEAR